MDTITNETKLNTMVIYPNGVVNDIDLTDTPVVGQRLLLNNKSYRIVETHDSAHERWKWVITLGN